MPPLLQSLRDTNRRLSFWLDHQLAPHRQPGVPTPEHMAALLSELLLAGASLRTEPVSAENKNPELDRELEAYRGNVERLRDLLPSIHSQLLAERARLEVQRARVKSAGEWARASRQTL